MNMNTKNRIDGVDVVRVVAVLAVIVIHAHAFETTSVLIGKGFNFPTFLNQVSRFAVPYFFTISGYFGASKFADNDQLWQASRKMVERLLFIFVGWSLIYLLLDGMIHANRYGPLGIFKIVYWNAVKAASHPFITMLQGTKVHLWFVIALVSCVIISTFFLLLNCERSLYVTAVGCYLIGLAGKAYADTPLGFHAEFEFRNGPFFGLLFFVMGYVLNRKLSYMPTRWLKAGLVYTGVGFLIHFAELNVLYKNYNTTTAQEYTIGIYLVGLGVSMVALANPTILRVPQIASMSRYVPGVYASHYLFIDLFRPLFRPLTENQFGAVFYVTAVFFLSYLTAVLLSQHKYLSKLVC